MGNCWYFLIKRRKNILVEGKDEDECKINLINKLNILYPNKDIKINKNDVLIDGNKKYNIDILEKQSNKQIVFNSQYIDYDNY
jgi:hypothetical protein